MADPENKNYTQKGIEPLFSMPESAQIIIIGQAPGIKAQESHKLWNDLSGKRLREWLNVSEELFYESGKFAILPMDFYYPGKNKNGDLPPRKKFAEKWHPEILKALPQVKLIILIGSYAQNYYLKGKQYKNLTETVHNFRNYLPKFFPIVHPSPLNTYWLKKNPWFEKEIVLELQKRVAKILI